MKRREFIKCGLTALVCVSILPETKSLAVNINEMLADFDASSEAGKQFYIECFKNPKTLDDREMSDKITAKLQGIGEYLEKRANE